MSFLSRRDEAALDESEGVPWMYEKKYLKVRRMPQAEAGEEWKTEEGEEIEAMTYVDVQRVTDGRIDKEYVVWIDKAIDDGHRCGMPLAYVDKYITKYLPDPSVERTKHANVMMVRTLQFGEKSASSVPRGFASWSRG